MKQITCQDLGGPNTCTEVITGSTADEMIANGWSHIEATHPEFADGIKNNPPEVNEKWQAEFHQKFDLLPEV